MAPMIVWRGRELHRYSEIGAVAAEIARDGDREAAAELLDTYRRITPHADSNLGYIAGYYDAVTMQAIFDVFGVAHPVFGTSTPTPAEAFHAGRRLGEALRRSADPAEEAP